MALAGKGTLHPGVLPVQALNQALSGRPVLKVVSLSAALFFPSVCYLFVQLCFFVVVVVVAPVSALESNLRLFFFFVLSLSFSLA